MENTNSVTLVGAVGSVHKNQIDKDNAVVKLSVATSLVNRRTGIETTWHPVTAWESKKHPLPDIKQGSFVKVTGRLRCIRYTDSEGGEKQFYDILANTLEKVEGPLEVPEV